MESLADRIGKLEQTSKDKTAFLNSLPVIPEEEEKECQTTTNIGVKRSCSVMLEDEHGSTSIGIGTTASSGPTGSGFSNNRLIPLLTFHLHVPQEFRDCTPDRKSPEICTPKLMFKYVRVHELAEP
jgi:hypothetical protein